MQTYIKADWEVYEMKCLRCAYEWKPRLERPNKCPACRTNQYDIPHTSKCETCKRTFFKLIIHHIDGNHNNSHDANRMIICQDCHGVIHMGLKMTDGKTAAGETRKSRERKYKNCPKVRYKLNKLRRIWLSSKYGLSAPLGKE